MSLQKLADVTTEIRDSENGATVTAGGRGRRGPSTEILSCCEEAKPRFPQPVVHLREVNKKTQERLRGSQEEGTHHLILDWFRDRLRIHREMVNLQIHRFRQNQLCNVPIFLPENR
jgi:hypothetical protein